MAKNTQAFRLWCRSDRGGRYYYKLPGGKWTATNCTDRAVAEQAARDAVRNGEQRNTNIANARLLAAQLGRPFMQEDTPRGATLPLREYAADFYRWDFPNPPACPRIARRLQDRKRIGPEWAREQRKRLTEYVFKDSIADLPMGTIRRGDVQDFRSRLLVKLGATDPDSPRRKRHINLILGALSGVFAEAVDREEIGRNPAAKLSMGYEPTIRGTFTEAEIRALFPARIDRLGPWRTLMEKTIYLVGFTCGLRRSELRALTWAAVDLGRQEITVQAAVKGKNRIGKPKSGRSRPARFGNVTARHLKTLRPADPDAGALVFAYASGAMVGGTWWQYAWRRALEKLAIDWRGRHLTAHSFRHTAASELRARGIDDSLLMGFGGWQSKAVADIYAGHGTETGARAIADAMDRLLG